MKNGLIVDEYGNKFWCLNGKLHREDGPAVEYADGSKHWYVNGVLHRENGPAVEWFDELGSLGSWYLNDNLLSEEEWYEAMTVKLLDRI